VHITFDLDGLDVLGIEVSLPFGDFFSSVAESTEASSGHALNHLVAGFQFSIGGVTSLLVEVVEILFLTSVVRDISDFRLFLKSMSNFGENGRVSTLAISPVFSSFILNDDSHALSN
jgi:hypothetical protein